MSFEKRNFYPINFKFCAVKKNYVYHFLLKKHLFSTNTFLKKIVFLKKLFFLKNHKNKNYSVLYFLFLFLLNMTLSVDHFGNKSNIKFNNFQYDFILLTLYEQSILKNLITNITLTDETSTRIKH